MKKIEVLECINLAILANGGEDFREDWCQCDPSVDQSPCEYCAIYRALKHAHEFIVKVGVHSSYTDVQYKSIL